MTIEMKQQQAKFITWSKKQIRYSLTDVNLLRNYALLNHHYPVEHIRCSSEELLQY
jgi:hypothetical protein